jgi:hypothetical protein
MQWQKNVGKKTFKQSTKNDTEHLRLGTANLNSSELNSGTLER